MSVVSGTILHRLSVHKYSKSGKVIAFLRPRNSTNLLVLDLNLELDGIRNVRVQKGIQSSALVSTDYFVEVEVTVQAISEKEQSYQCNFVRMLSRTDTDIKRWHGKDDLGTLPVSPHHELTLEERYWAGERESTIGRDLFFSAIAASLVAGSIAFALQGNWIAAVAFAAMGVAGIRGASKLDWQIARKPKDEKVFQIQKRKNELQILAQQGQARALSEFDRRLEDFQNWVHLSPYQFEHAVARALEKDGYSAVNVTQQSSDGGIDVVAVAPDGRPAIIQAKQYQGKVGVSAVREIIGVRAGRDDMPHAVVFALSGFTRGAWKLANESDVELLDARSRTMRI